MELKLNKSQNSSTLATNFSSSNNPEVAVKHRIGLGWAAFGKHEQLIKSKRVSIHIKSKIYLTYILPVVLYGLDCVTWTQKLENLIETFQNHIMRFITGHRLIDKTKLTALRRITHLSPIVSKIRSKTLKLYGHIKRSKTGLSKLCLEGMVPGKRGRGRPKQRWRDNILSWSAAPSWNSLNQLTQERKRWKEISHVSSQSAPRGSSD